MAKVVVGKLTSTAGKGKTDAGVAVTEKRIHDAEGKPRIVRTVDAGSRSFGADLRYVFEKNVAKARRDNKRVTGVTDVAPAKR